MRGFAHPVKLKTPVFGGLSNSFYTWQTVGGSYGHNRSGNCRFDYKAVAGGGATTMRLRVKDMELVCKEVGIFGGFARRGG